MAPQRLMGVCLLLAAGCARTTTIPGPCGAPPNDAVCFGAMTVPAGQEAKFREGTQMAIAAVMSPDFERRLDEFIRAHAADPKLAEAWGAWGAAQIVAGERARLTPAIGVQIWDGPGALYYRVFKHNIALEGRDKPEGGREVEENRFALSGRTPGDLADTFAHEVSHAAGLRHPDSDTNLRRAFCEPPYVIGTIIQQIAEGDAWRWDGSGDCACFKPGADQRVCVP